MSLWSQAKAAADATPEHRNRTVDFFRAVAILVVIFGHWLVSVPQYVDGGLEFTKLLVLQPWTQYVTWVVQVMPIFFFVGGFSNMASWTAAARDPESRRTWAATRLRRLILPIGPLVVFWAVASAIAARTGLDPQFLAEASRAALIPIWFLAVYVVVTVAVPVTAVLWERFGLWSVIALVAAAAAVDALAFAGGLEWMRWSNYAFIWLSAHQLGYWWQRGASTRAGGLLLVAAGLASLWLLVGPLGYPVSMISVPGAEISNSRPPTFAMLAVGFTQIGVIVLLSERIERWLKGSGPWAVVILISQWIMTVYLWHLTALIALVGLSLLIGGLGLRIEPGSGLWWATRPLWIVALILALLPLAAIFGRFETMSRGADRVLPGPVQATIGALFACAGLTFLALNGAWGDNVAGVNYVPVLCVLAGLAVATLGRRART